MIKYINNNNSIMNPTEQRTHTNIININDREFQIQNKTMAGLAKKCHDKLSLVQSDIDQIQQRLNHVPPSLSHDMDVNNKFIKKIAKLYKIGKSLPCRNQSGGGTNHDNHDDPFIMILKRWGDLILEMETSLGIIRERREMLKTIERKKVKSATRIQSKIRQIQAKEQIRQMTTENEKENKASILIQKYRRARIAKTNAGKKIIERLNESPVMVLFMFEFICIKRYIKSLSTLKEENDSTTSLKIKTIFGNVKELIFINNTKNIISQQSLKDIGIEKEKVTINIINTNIKQGNQ